MMIYLFLAVAAILVAAGLFLPAFLRQKASLSHADSASRMLIDQLNEVDREVACGLISSRDAQAVRIEVKRQLVAIDQREASSSPNENSGLWALMAAGVFVPAFAIAVYLTIGSPEIPSAVFAQRGEELSLIATHARQVQNLVDQLERDVNGGSFEGWIRVAEMHMKAEQYAQAADAFGRVLRRDEVTFSEFFRYAEALILSERGVVSPPAKRALKISLEMNPDNVAAVFYSSFALDQAGQVEAAYEMLITRLNKADGDYPWMEAFVARANHYGRKLGRSPVSRSGLAFGVIDADEGMTDFSGLSEEQQQEFILSMVEGLADLLEEDPDDLDGWLKLARAYSALGNKDAELDTYLQARELVEELPKDDRRRTLVQKKLSIMR